MSAISATSSTWTSFAVRGLHLGVDPLGGAGVHYWPAIAERYRLELTVVNEAVDPTFRFMTVDWDGRIRMDPSSPYAMQTLIGLKDRFDIAFACDTDHDRHGIVTRAAGLLRAQSLSCRRHRLPVSTSAAVAQARGGGQDRRQQPDDRSRRREARPQRSTKCRWDSSGSSTDCSTDSLGFARRGERRRVLSAPRRHGVDDRQGRHRPGAARPRKSPRARAAILPRCYRDLDAGARRAGRATASQARGDARSKRQRLARLSPQQFRHTELAGETIQRVLDRAPGNDAPIGGLKVIAASGWFAARPSGTEDIYKIYAESFRGEKHLRPHRERGAGDGRRRACRQRANGG